ncbi:MAG: hypothetical protein ABW019_05715 [Chitinophagaceae bacterium]
MNRIGILKTTVVIRVAVIILFFILEWLLKRAYAKQPGLLDGMEIEFSWWQQLIGWLVPIILFSNTVVSLLVAFRPDRVIRPGRGSKTWLHAVYFAELLIFPFFLYLVIMDIRDIFFPPVPHLINVLLEPVFPVNHEARAISKAQTINLAAGCLCSLLFLILLPPVWKARSAQPVDID